MGWLKGNDQEINKGDVRDGQKMNEIRGEQKRRERWTKKWKMTKGEVKVSKGDARYEQKMYKGDVRDEQNLNKEVKDKKQRRR